MPNIQELVDGLMNHDDKEAYNCLKELEAKSSSSTLVYPFFDTFVAMLDSDNSYIRTRGILLIAANARWDIGNKIDKIIDRYLKCITDEKPITVRQFIKALPTIAKYKPGLRKVIETTLNQANLSSYQDNMQSLILKDIQKALNDISMF